MAAFSAATSSAVKTRSPAEPQRRRTCASARTRAILRKRSPAEPAAPAYSPIVLAGLVRIDRIRADRDRPASLDHFFYVVRSVGAAAGLFIVAIALSRRWRSSSSRRCDIYQVAGFRARRAAWSASRRRLDRGVSRRLRRRCSSSSSKAYLSRVWIVGWFVVGLGALLIERGCAVVAGRVRLTRSGRLERRTVVVGGGARPRTAARPGQQKDTRPAHLGVFDDRSDDRSPDVVAGYPKLGNVDDLVEFARHTRIDLVIFALPITAEQRLLQMLRKLWVLPIDIRLAAHTNKLRFRPRSYSYIG